MRICSLLIIALLLACGSASAATVIVETLGESGLKHPGCLQSAAEINALAAALSENDPTRTAYWDAMMANSRGKVYGTDWIPPEHLEGLNFSGPAKYSGAGLIRYVNDWIINGDATSEAAAITMLNRWAAVKSFTPDPSDGYRHHRLGSQWLGYLAHAADLLISSGTSWPVVEQDAFKWVVRTIFLPIANDDRAATFNGNWDLGATWAVMAMAVLLDDKDLFDEQIAWLKDGETNARISYYLLASGQNQESARDQTHVAMGLTHLSLAVQTAWTQGIDLYEYDNRSLGRAFEYYAAYNLGEEDLPFQVYPCAVGSNSAHDFNTEISDIGRYDHKAIHEMVYHHYKNYRGVELPYVGEMLEMHTRPENPGPTWSNHNTALYWNLDLSADAAQRGAQSADVSLGIDPDYAGRAVLRLNSGGPHYGAADGRAFTKQKGVWVDGRSRKSHNLPIANTADPELYQSYRSGSNQDTLYYHFDLPPGEYRVRFHFAEPEFTSSGQRVFNLYLEDEQILENFDIFAEAGFASAYVHDTSVQLVDGTLNVAVESVTGAALVNAIEIEPLLDPLPLVETGSVVGMGSASPLDGGDILVGAEGFQSRNREVIRTDTQQFAVGQSFRLAEGWRYAVSDLYLKSKSKENFDAYPGRLQIKVFSGAGDSGTLLATYSYDLAAWGDGSSAKEVTTGEWVRFSLGTGLELAEGGIYSFLIFFDSSSGDNNIHKWSFYRDDSGVYAEGNQWEGRHVASPPYEAADWDTHPWNNVFADENDDFMFYVGGSVR